MVRYAGKDASEEFNMMHKVGPSRAVSAPFSDDVQANVVAKYAPQTVLGTVAQSSKL